MALISLKCPQCGGEIQLDDIREIGFCMYCGNKVVVQEAVKRQVVLDESHKIEGWVALGHDTLRSRNYLDAEQYANKIIEIDFKNPDAWYIKGCCAINEQVALENWRKAFNYSDKNEPLKKAITEALNRPKDHFQTRMKTVTFIRGSSMGGGMRTFYISLNDKERIALANGETRSVMIEEGSYILKGQIASYKTVVPLAINKDTTVYISLNKKDQKWDIISN